MPGASLTYLLPALILLAAAVTPSVRAQPQSPAVNAIAIQQIVQRGIDEHRWPGAVIVIGHNNHIIFHHAFGNRSLEPTVEAMTEDTIFDMASLSKCLATTTAIMQLAEQGKLRLDDPVSTYLPAFAAHNKQDITLRDLLTHYSGLPADLDLSTPWQGREEGYRRALDTTPVSPAGVEFRYSDINFITLGLIVEKVSGQPLEQYYATHIAAPLHLHHSGFLPPQSWLPLIAPTQYDEHHVMLRGIVHDPTSRRMGGVAGHAGLFSTAQDVAIYSQALLDRLHNRPSSFPLTTRTAIKMTTPAQPATGLALRALGWDIESPFSSNRGALFPVGSFGHTGFTGTSLWIDPASDTYVIILASHVHPDGGESVVGLRNEIATVVASNLNIANDHGNLAARLTGYNESISGLRRWPARNASVLTGIDVLSANNFNQLTAIPHANPTRLRLGLLTNQTGLTKDGQRTIDILATQAPKQIPGLQLTTLFSPEHGIAGNADTYGIGSATDSATNLPIISLYGSTEASRHPSPEALRSLDAVLIDLADVGTRFYTYESVLRYFLETGSQTHTPIIVLDRPNPITGSFVQGPLSDATASSYVDVAPIPIRHGLTLGELAQYLNATLHLQAPLTVVKMQGWQRGDWFDSTALEWTNPSPNLRNLTEAILYPGIGLIEQTNLSVGRGTDTPFELLGAPWVHSVELAEALNKRDLPGIRFIPTSFTPSAPYPYAGQVCHGVQLLVTDRNQLNSPELGLEIASALHKLYPNDYQLQKLAALLGNTQVLQDLTANRDPHRIEEDWQPALNQFKEAIKPYLLY